MEQNLIGLLQSRGIEVKTLEPLGGGDDSDAYLLNGTQVAKLPKRREVQLAQKQEFALYEWLSQTELAPMVPRAVGWFEEFCLVSYLPGRSITYWEYHQLSPQEQQRLAQDEAAFLRKLHQIPLDPADPVLAPILEGRVQDKRQRFLEDREAIFPILQEQGALSPELERKLEGFYEFLLSQDWLYRFSPCLVHGDFSAENMRFTHNRLTGVIDFGDFLLGDPDQDFLCLLDNSTDDFGKEFGRMVLDCYGHPNPALAQRKAEVNDLYWGVEQVLMGSRDRDRELFCQGLADLGELDWES